MFFRFQGKRNKKEFETMNPYAITPGIDSAGVIDGNAHHFYSPEEDSHGNF
jgi:hypothetical protein